MTDRRQIYQDAIEDIALEISIAKAWRSRIFALPEGGTLQISAADGDALPAYIRDVIVQNDLTVCVRITEDCAERFDDGMTVFAFSAAEYPEIRAYSGNNPKIQ
jgi:hypothetical protein